MVKKAVSLANEAPLVEDIRMLGRLLGNVIREQEGVSTFALIEKVRVLSVTFRRDADDQADRQMKEHVNNPPQP